MSDPVLLGNAPVRARLARAADEDRMHHCYLFEGPPGVGKHTTAMWLARRCNCLAEPAAAPCGQCGPCRSILANTHPDVIVVEPDPERATRILSIDQARGVLAAMVLQRHSARKRFVVLDPADLLNEEAANALLKTLEEPPAGTHFILVTARPAGLLPTVRSRSQRVRFGAVPVAELAPWLQARGLDPALAELAAGSPGQALQMSTELEARRQLCEGLLGAVGQPLHRLFAFTEELGKKDGGTSRAEGVVDLLEELLRDVVLVAQGRGDPAEGAAIAGTVSPLRHPDQLPVLRDWARALWPGGISRLGTNIALARERLLSNVNGRVVLEALLAALNLELAAMPRGRAAGRAS